MTDSPNTPRDELDPRRLTDAQVVRALADAELESELRERLGALSQSDPRLDERVAFERSLREAVGRVMGPAQAPAGLPDAVLDAMRDEGAGADSGPIPFTEAARDAEARPHWSRPWWIGIAAAVAIVVGISIFYPFGSSTIPGRPVGPLPQNVATSPSTQSEPAIKRVADFVEKEGSRCAYLGDLTGDAKFVYQSKSEAEAAAIKLLDEVPDVFDLPDCRLAKLGYSFAGLGECHLPLGNGASAHLIYKTADESLPSISLWVQKDGEHLCTEMVKKGTCYGVKSQVAKNGKGDVNVWREDGLLYILFVPRCDKSLADDLTDPARKAFHAPEVVRDLTI